MANVIRIPPYHYIHVQDTNSNTLSLVQGPKIYVKQDHERLKSGSDPVPMTRLPPRHYAIILNPVIRTQDGTLVTDKFGQASLRLGDIQIRFQQDYPQPYSLHPGEVCKKIEQLQIVAHNCALMIEAERSYTDSEGNQRNPGDRWYFFGPGTYRPRIQELIVKRVKSVIIKINQALRLRAERELTDSQGEKRKAGEEWLVRKEGSYLPGVYQENIKTVNACILTDSYAIMLRASRGFTDVYGKYRKAGEEWLVTQKMSDTHIIDIFEQFAKEVQLTVLTKNQYCVIVDPWDEESGSNRFGYRLLKVGQDSFFLQPGEYLEGGIKNKYVLLDDEALLLRANESIEVEGQQKKPGDRWMIHGPCKYIPPIQVQILEVRKAIPLHVNEGIYVRDIRSGVVRAEFGKTYMLKAHQELWEMNLSDTVQDLLARGGWRKAQLSSPSIFSKREKSRVVSFKVFSNAAVQIYDYKEKKSRVVAGPDLVHLLPDQQFTVSVLSGGKPKRVGVIHSLFLTLGPDFSTDIIQVDTSDHARLRIQLSYNWKFGIEDENYNKVFKVRDFVGNLCNFMAAKVREAVAIHTFQQFHKTSARIVRKSIFGLDEEGKIKDNFVFPDNNLLVTNVDIQSIEPVDRNTRERLRESVTLAIEITARSEQDKARHAAEIQAQEAQGIIQKLGIGNLAKVEQEKVKLYQLQGESESVQNEGLALAHAKAKAEASKVKFQSEVEEAQLRTKAERLVKQNDISHIKLKQNLEIEQQKLLDQLQIEKARSLAEIEADKFKKTIGSIGSETLVAISEAGPKMQAELLEGLGLQGYMLMDTDNPVNLFNTAQGMLSNLPQTNN